MNGIIVINKPKEFTSFDVVAVVRKLTGEKKAGHTGTLDPNATGVLPVLLGSATKAQDIIPIQDKSYVADFLFGKATDTLDIWGSVLEEKESHITESELLCALERFKGKITQLPPMYSAVSVGGKRLYEYARQGIEVERKSREVTICSIELLCFDEAAQKGRLRVSCSKGTYIRTLIADIAKALSTVGCMTALTRTSACGFTLDDAITLDELKAQSEQGEIAVRTVESLFSVYPVTVVSDKQAHRFKNGNPLDLIRIKDIEKEDKKIYRVQNKSGAFLSLGITDLEKGVLKLYKHF